MFACYCAQRSLSCSISWCCLSSCWRVAFNRLPRLSDADCSIAAAGQPPLYNYPFLSFFSSLLGLMLFLLSGLSRSHSLPSPSLPVKFSVPFLCRIRQTEICTISVFLALASLPSHCLALPIRVYMLLIPNFLSYLYPPLIHSVSVNLPICFLGPWAGRFTLRYVT